MRFRSISSRTFRPLRNIAAITLLIFFGVLAAHAEKLSDLPAKPTGYVNDYAGVLSDDTRAQLEQLCQQVDTQAHAQIAIVTIKSLEDDDIEDFSNRLFHEWGIGQKGTDRGVLILLAIQDRKRRIEVGYGLEGILPDGKVGDIGRDMVPALKAGNYDSALETGTVEVANVIAADAHVQLSTGNPQQQAQRSREQGSPLGIFIFIAIIFLVVTLGGRSGLLWFLLGNFLGGGFGGNGRNGGGWGSTGGWGGGGDGGGGFGGFGGGDSGGGGASGGW